MPRDQIPSNVQTATDADMERFHAEGTLSRMMTKAVFRAVNLMTPLRTVFLAGR